MSRFVSGIGVLGLVAIACWGLSGCGSSGKDAADANADASQVAHVDGNTESNDTAHADYNLPDEPASETGPAESLLLEIRTLRHQPIGAGTDAVASNGKSARLDAQEIEQIRAQRNHEIIEKATEAIALSHEDPAQEEVFNEAVRQLMEARLELALQDLDEMQDLYAARDMLLKRASKLYPGEIHKSKAAADASYAVARFAHTKARDFAAKEPRWLEEFATQARLFASTFPNENAKAASLLQAAGWSCELHGLNEQALACYTDLRKSFPESPQGQQVAAVLRRLNLVGKPVQLAGQTLDGKYLSIDDLKGKTVLIVFWASDNPSFHALLPKLSAAAKQYANKDLAILGVCLDEDQEALESFLKTHSIDWPQIFTTDPAKRRWNNEIVKYYGVRHIPQLWLIDRQGIALDVQLNADQLEARIETALSRGRRAAQ